MLVRNPDVVVMHLRDHFKRYSASNDRQKWSMCQSFGALATVPGTTGWIAMKFYADIQGPLLTY